MVIVKDTESFIAKSRQIHGDKYDYSKTVYLGAQKPITIICRKCRKEFELSQAGSHYRKRKPCGCRNCRIRKHKTCQCGFRGYGSRAFPRNAGGLCSTCWSIFDCKWEEHLWSSLVYLQKSIRRKGKLSTNKWDMWAYRKHISICIRSKKNHHEIDRNTGKIESNWEHFFNKQQRVKEEDKWQIKMRQWVHSLESRKKLQEQN